MEKDFVVYNEWKFYKSGAVEGIKPHGVPKTLPDDPFRRQVNIVVFCRERLREAEGRLSELLPDDVIELLNRDVNELKRERN